MQKFCINELLNIIPYEHNSDEVMPLAEAKDNKNTVVQTGILKLLNNETFYIALKTNGALLDFVKWVTKSKTKVHFLSKSYDWTDTQAIALLTVLGSNNVYHAKLNDRTIKSRAKNDDGTPKKDSENKPIYFHSPETLEHLIEFSMGIRQPSTGSKKLKLLQLDEVGLKRSITEISDRDHQVVLAAIEKLICRGKKLTQIFEATEHPEVEDYYRMWGLNFSINSESKRLVPVRNIIRVYEPELVRMLTDSVTPVMPGANSIATIQKTGISSQLVDLKSAVEKAQSLQQNYDDTTIGSAMFLQGRIGQAVDSIEEAIALLEEIKNKSEL
ncbi:hypothetical protein JK163_04235 [Levilactobacillus brevis]|uniref:hypothetical protein n=1 Tax=Levilactobacillus brevis TaxID=1580 RepID=UPI001BAB34FB|nr:hypothetical protein [Levilactobacillus brevis]MBS1005515.1 hypothetical protein [Levilactobacillus brevis]